MNIFQYREKVLNTYIDYVASFVSVKAPDVAAVVDEHFESGSLWPDPVLQLNPLFQPGAQIDQLVEEGVLHAGCSDIFRRGKESDSDGSALTLHRHQEEAIRIAAAGMANVVIHQRLEHWS